MDDFGTNGIVIPDEIEPGYLIPFRWRDEGLSGEQMWLAGKRDALWERKLETGAIVERVARECCEARVPHQPRIEGRVDDHRRAAHVARSRAMWSHYFITVNADGDGLRVAKAGGG